MKNKVIITRKKRKKTQGPHDNMSLKNETTSRPSETLNDTPHDFRQYNMFMAGALQAF